jgi:outer membrane protein OmpU
MSLLATTALAMSAGVAYAEISISGNARMGLQHVGKVAAKAAVQGSLTADEASAILTAAEATDLEVLAATSTMNNLFGSADEDGTWAITSSGMATALAYRAESAAELALLKAAAAAAQDGDEGLATAIEDAEAELALVDAAIAAASGSAAVAAKDSTTKFEKRMTVTMSGSVETTSGLTFGATMNLRANEGSAAVTTGARVHMATGGVEVGVGNINGAIEWMPGVYSASAGLTGLGWGGMAVNTAAKGAFGWDAYSSSGNGAEGIEVMYSAGSFSGHLSYSDTDLGSAGNNTAGYVAYTMGDWTVAAGMQDSSVNANDKTVLTVGGKVGDFGVGIAYADNDGEAKIALNGSATFGATTVSMYVADEESATDSPMGLGVKHDLGGASLVGGVAKTASGQTRADMGVKFSF